MLDRWGTGIHKGTQLKFKGSSFSECKDSQPMDNMDTNKAESWNGGVPAWQGVPQPQLPAGQMPQIQQPASVLGTYPVQQFQLLANLAIKSSSGEYQYSI
ncbi:hypothetical protein Avbf_06449 [Armadillidium vulgare]|nr:hypothetical protein Avbf_06449 [Armadillidium vulgare]